MQVAIISNDASNVDEHFGRAERFLIYEIEGSNQTPYRHPGGDAIFRRRPEPRLQSGAVRRDRRQADRLPAALLHQDRRKAGGGT